MPIMEKLANTLVGKIQTLIKVLHDAGEDNMKVILEKVAEVDQTVVKSLKVSLSP